MGLQHSISNYFCKLSHKKWKVLFILLFTTTVASSACTINGLPQGPAGSETASPKWGVVLVSGFGTSSTASLLEYSVDTMIGSEKLTNDSVAELSTDYAGMDVRLEYALVYVANEEPSDGCGENCSENCIECCDQCRRDNRDFKLYFDASSVTLPSDVNIRTWYEFLDHQGPTHDESSADRANHVEQWPHYLIDGSPISITYSSPRPDTLEEWISLLRDHHNVDTEKITRLVFSVENDSLKEYVLYVSNRRPDGSFPLTPDGDTCSTNREESIYCRFIEFVESIVNG